MERNVPTERDFYRNGIFLSRGPYHWRGKEAGKFKKKHRRSENENFGVNYCNTKSVCFYVHN